MIRASTLQAGLFFTVLATGLLGCGGDGGTQCGAGTVAANGACVPVVVDVVTCGAGTVAVDGACIAQPAPDVSATDIGGDPTADALEDTGETPPVDTSADLGEPEDTAADDTVDTGPELNDVVVPADVDPGDAGPDDAGPNDVGEPDVAPPVDVSGDDVTDTGPIIPSCVPNCLGRACGDDGCGGQCGQCDVPGLGHCNLITGKCEAACVPSCQGRSCGDDGCGGACGECTGGASCSGIGRCVPAGWTCNAGTFGAYDGCNCMCGARDPDCDIILLPTLGCGSYEACGAGGTCAPTVPVAWTCDKEKYGAIDSCDCGCGAADPDCAFSLAVVGCGQGGTCATNGTCVACVPKCDGKACGPDGCGGSCGSCDDPAADVCADGVCVDPCGGPVPLICKTASCGTDGCGGSCGTCPDGSFCLSGTCVDNGPGPDSCEGHCGSSAPSGCSCAKACDAKGTCCGDYVAACGCTAKCTGKTCGSDGCGGSCGTCGAGAPYCDATVSCVATCTPKCDGLACGDDGCGGQCGTCESGLSCIAGGRCVPTAWKCPNAYYGDGKDCDCGCGAADPDCKAGAKVVGCPAAGACGPAGFCVGDFCNSDGDCSTGWCTGLWPVTSSTYAGVCGPPIAFGAPAETPCDFGGQCGSGVCLGGACRTHCAADADCDSGEVCLAAQVSDGATGDVLGFAGICMSLTGSAAPCSSQAACAAVGQQCVARIDAKTLGPRYLCEDPPAEPAVGASCAQTGCPAWQVCAAPASAPTKPVCSPACPGGAADCASGWQCVMRPLHSNGTHDLSDDPAVPVCLP